MKKILSTVLPSLIILTFILVDSTIPDSKNIILGIYILFPIIFAIQGLLCSYSKKDFLSGFILSSLAVIVPTSILYNMGSCVPPVVIYVLIGCTTFVIIRRYYKNSM